jgi:hypothetical protein
MKCLPSKGKTLNSNPSTILQQKKGDFAGCWWFTPVILTTQEAEMRRIVVQGQPGQNSLGDPISKTAITKRTGGVVQDEGPEFKPQHHHNKKR